MRPGPQTHALICVQAMAVTQVLEERNEQGLLEFHVDTPHLYAGNGC